MTKEKNIENDGQLCFKAFSNRDPAWAMQLNFLSLAGIVVERKEDIGS